MASNLSTIGLRLADDALDDLLLEVATKGRLHRVAGGAYHQHTLPDGAELWVQTDTAGRLIGFSPHFAGVEASTNGSRVESSVTDLVPDDRHPLDGAMLCKCAAGDSVGVPFLVHVPDFHSSVERAAGRDSVSLQIAAFAHRLECFSTEDAYFGSQRSARQRSEGPKIAVESFIPAGLFSPDPHAPAVAPSAMAILSGRVLAARCAPSPVTGQHYHAMQVKTYIGVVDLVADLSVVQGEPAVGGVATGTVWLSGRVRTESEERSAATGARQV